jgi:hypothetical protein
VVACRGGVLDVDTDTNKYLYDADYKVHKHLYIHVWTTTWSLFDEQLVEVVDDNIRYILRRNPMRAQELAATRQSKLQREEGSGQSGKTQDPHLDRYPG